MSILEAGEAALDRMFECAAVPVSYRRGDAVLAADIPAKLGRTLFRTEIAGNVTVRIEQRDFIVRAADMDRTPEVGDLIEFGGKRYLVCAPEGEPCWRWHTRVTHTQKRIHARYMGDLQND